MARIERIRHCATCAYMGDWRMCTNGNASLAGFPLDSDSSCAMWKPKPMRDEDIKSAQMYIVDIMIGGLLDGETYEELRRNTVTGTTGMDAD